MIKKEEGKIRKYIYDNNHKEKCKRYFTIEKFYTYYYSKLLIK